MLNVERWMFNVNIKDLVMSGLYFLVSSLPSLKEGQAPPLSSEDLMSRCCNWLSEKEMGILRKISLAPDQTEEKPTPATLAEWKSWEISFRNRIVKTRKPAFPTDPAAHLRNETNYYSAIERGVQDAFASTDPLSREKLLDGMRWKKLEDLESGHMFDFSIICIYMLKLLILEKNSQRTIQKGTESFDMIMDVIQT